MIDLAHIHPMLVHFPLALLPVALGFQLYALVRGESLFSRGWAQNAAMVLLMLAATAAVAAAMFGDVALDQAVATGVSESLLDTHEDLGMTSAVLLVLLALGDGWLFWRRQSSMKVSWGFWLVGAVVFLVLIVTAWHGGRLVYDLGINVHLKGH